MVRSVEERNDTVLCERCGQPCERRLAVPQLAVDRWVYRDYNRETRDATDVLADMKADEKRNERSWEPNPPDWCEA